MHRLSAIRLSDAELEYKKHVERGHFPYRSDCRECLRGAGKRRPHRSRGPTVDSFSLAADLGGPYVAGLSEQVHAEAEVSVCCLLLFSDT